MSYGQAHGTEFLSLLFVLSTPAVCFLLPEVRATRDSESGDIERACRFSLSLFLCRPARINRASQSDPSVAQNFVDLSTGCVCRGPVVGFPSVVASAFTRHNFACRLVVGNNANCLPLAFDECGPLSQCPLRNLRTLLCRETLFSHPPPFLNSFLSPVCLSAPGSPLSPSAHRPSHVRPRSIDRIPPSSFPLSVLPVSPPSLSVRRRRPRLSSDPSLRPQSRSLFPPARGARVSLGRRRRP